MAQNKIRRKGKKTVNFNEKMPSNTKYVHVKRERPLIKFPARRIEPSQKARENKAFIVSIYQDNTKVKQFAKLYETI